MRRTILLSLLFTGLMLGVVPCACGGEEGDQAVPPEPPRRVLRSTLGGSWYPAKAEDLRADLDAFAGLVKQEPIEGVRALVLPHAGYRWAGEVGAHGARHIAGRKYSRVVVMGPSHRRHLENVVSIPAATHYATTLGEVPLDVAFLEALARHPQFTRAGVHAREHSVQMQVPVLQHALGDFRLVPLVVGDLDRATTRRVADVLLSLIDAATLVVVSSDFAHYGPRFGFVPFTEDVPANLRKLDMDAYAAIERIDADAFVSYLDRTESTICGRRAIEVLLRMLPKDAKAALCRYDTSGRIGGDWSNSVSYLSIALRATWPTREEPAVETSNEYLTTMEKAALYRIARASLARALAGGELPTPDELGIELTPRLSGPSGAFVTLRREEALRGCIGEIHPSRPLWKAVAQTAVASALRDHRFRPVTADELDEIDVKISVLTPPRPVSGWEEIEVGRHGIVLQKDGRSATFLPQVAPEQGWDLDQTLTRLAMKAGLPADGWHEGATFLVFEAEVFGKPDA